MKESKQHIAHWGEKDIKTYVRGKMKADQVQVFEAAMQEDPFLKDAVDGFKEHPGAIQKIDKVKKQSFKVSNSRWNTWWAWSASALALMLITVSGLLLTRQSTLEQIEQNEMSQSRNAQRIQEELAEEKAQQEAAEIEESTFIAVLTQDTDSSVRIAVNTDHLEAESHQHFIHIRPIDWEELDEFEEEDFIPVLEENSGEPVARTYDTYHLEDYLLFDYRDERAESLQVLKPVLGGVPANKSHAEDENESDLVYEEVPYADFIRRSIVKLSEKKYRSAYKMFNQVLEVYPNDINALFYRSYCSFELKKYERSINEFEEVLSDVNSVFDEDAEYHLALAKYSFGYEEDAVADMERISANIGYYSWQATEWLKANQ